jgi:cyclopropane-fatty-acyl-phospholipid synthase
VSAAHVETSSASATLALLEDVLGHERPRDFAIRLWDGSMLPPDPGETARFTIVLERAGALKAMFLPPTELALGEAYVHGDFDVEGDIEGLFSLADRLRGRNRGVAERLSFAVRLLALPVNRAEREHVGARPRGRLHSPERDLEAVTYHYDRPPGFFATFLDRRLVYSCAYFADPEEDLDTAQERKLDHICRKLRLGPGERLLDVGCGFGALALHAAARYGAEVHGITLSRPQADVAKERIAASGLDDRCRIEVRDYRDLQGEDPYDKIVSVGMFEHVGEALLPEYFAAAFRLLRPRGVFLNHGIARAKPVRRPSAFIQRYVFPDGELVPLPLTLTAAEKVGFEIRDVESLREHYVLTLRHWLERLEANHERAVAAADELSYRIWRLYMAGSAHGFATGRLAVFQTLLAKPENGDTALPLTRADWYAQVPGEPFPTHLRTRPA